MTTPSEYAKNAAAALHQTLHVSPGDFNAEGTTAVIEQAIRNATRERETEVRTKAQERLARLLSSSPAVIYSFEATGDFTPTFVSNNIIDVFGYAPAEYLQNPSFWRDRVHPSDLARVEKAISTFFQNGVHAVEYRFRHKDGSYCWVNNEIDVAFEIGRFGFQVLHYPLNLSIKVFHRMRQETFQPVFTALFGRERRTLVEHWVV